MLTDDSYRELQLYLLLNPEAGDVIPGSRGLRKLRWRLRGRGKRGGARVIYLLRQSITRIYFVCMYAKNARAGISVSELREMRSLINEE